MLKAYLGGDPGAKGAICALVPELNDVAFIDNIKSPLEVQHWLQQLKQECIIQATVLEEVHSLFGMSAKSNFSFGSNVREMQVIFELNEIPYLTVTPKIWQSKVGVTVKGTLIKQEVAEICKTLYPIVTTKRLIYGKNGGLLDGRSDALMIAHYCYLINNPLTLKDK